MDFEESSTSKDYPPLLTKARNYKERYSTLAGGQVDLQETELIQQDTVCHTNPNSSDRQCQLYRLYQIDNSSTAIQDSEKPSSQLGANLPSNELDITKSSANTHICCDTFQKRDGINDEKFLCGACRLNFITICQLHSHLKSKHSPEKYIFDFSISTAFPETDKVCSHTQTDFKDLIELDEEQFNEETDGYNDKITVESNYNDVDSDTLDQDYSDVKIKLESNIDAVDSDMLNQGYSDVSHDVGGYCSDVCIKVERNIDERNTSDIEDSDTINEGYFDDVRTDPNYHPSDSENEQSKDRSKLKQKKCNRAKKDCISPQVVKNSGQYQCKKTSKQCERCGKEFGRHQLRRHLRICNIEPHIKCDQCEMMFKTTKAMNHHKVVHSDERPYICHICGFAVKRPSALTQHMRTHNSEPQFLCTDCGLKLTSRSGLHRHKKIHTNDKPNVCKYCKKSFIAKGNLRTHLRQHTGETPYKCELCGKAFKQNVLLKLHLKSYHP